MVYTSKNQKGSFEFHDGVKLTRLQMVRLYESGLINEKTFLMHNEYTYECVAFNKKLRNCTAERWENLCSSSLMFGTSWTLYIQVRILKRNNFNSRKNVKKIFNIVFRNFLLNDAQRKLPAPKPSLLNCISKLNPCKSDGTM